MKVDDPHFAVSTWSVHRLLGMTYQNGPGCSEPFAPDLEYGTGSLALADLPHELAKRGYARVEICHFHLASLEPEYLRGVRDAFASENVEIQTLLIDKGDMTHAEMRTRDMEWIASWIDAAALLGARHARVIAGKAKPSAEALAVSIAGLRELGAHGAEQGVRIVTENWFDLLSGPCEVMHVLDALDGSVGFLADMGNWSGATKYADLETIFARAELSHTKAEFDARDAMNEDDFTQCLRAAQAGGYQGPHTLIYEGPGDEWAGLERARDFVMQAGRRFA
jgi:sugar phosphate isomerase/epimerase